MAFKESSTTFRRPQPKPKRMGRGLQILIVTALAIAAFAAVVQLLWGSWWRSEPKEVQASVRPAIGREFDDYEPRIPDPGVQLVAVPAARPVERERPQRAQSVTPQPVQRVEQRERAKPTRLGSVAWNVQADTQPEWFHDGRRELLGQGCALRPGVSIIPAKLLTAVNSEVTGQVVAETISHVYSPDAGYENKVLVPAGTRITGMLDKGPGMTLDRRRVDIAWQQMTNPRGFGGDQRYTQIDLGRGFNASADGSAGTGGRVQHRWGELALYALATTIFRVASRRATTDDVVILETGRTIGTVGERVLDRSLEWEPIVVIEAGTQVRVLVNDTVRVC